MSDLSRFFTKLIYFSYFYSEFVFLPLNLFIFIRVFLQSFYLVIHFSLNHFSYFVL